MNRDQADNLIIAVMIANQEVYRTYEERIRDIAKIANEMTEIERGAES